MNDEKSNKELEKNKKPKSFEEELEKRLKERGIDTENMEVYVIKSGDKIF